MRGIPQYRIASALHVGDIEDFEIERILKNYREIHTMICVFTDVPRVQGQARLVRTLKQRGTNVVVVLLGFPTHLPELTAADAIVLAYSDIAPYGQTLRAVADMLMGAAALRIVAPQDQIVFRVGEKRRFDALEVVRSPVGRLPAAISEDFPAGLSLSYDPTKAIKKAVWQFGKERVKKQRVEYAFDAPGRRPVTLTVTDRKKTQVSHTFNIDVRD